MYNVRILEFIQQGGLFACMDLLKELNNISKNISVVWNYTEPIIEYYKKLYSEKKLLFPKVCAQYYCYPENYVDSTKNNFTERLLIQLKRIKKDCYENQGQELSLHRFIEILHSQGMPKPKHNSFRHVQDIIEKHYMESS